MEEFLVDTNVILELMRQTPNEVALDWLCTHSDGVRMSSVTVKELYYGARRMNEGKRKTCLMNSIENVTALYGRDIYPFDARCALACARLHALVVSLGRTPTIENLMIAATAEVRGIPLLTRYIKDFEYLGISCANLFEGESHD